MSAWEVSKKYPGVRWRTTLRGSQVFYITFSRGGKKVWEKVGCRDDGYTAALAAKIRSDRLKEARGHKGKHQDENATFAQIANAYLDWSRTHKRSWQDDERRYRLYLAPRFGGCLAREISALDLERMQSEILRTRAPATVRQVLMLVAGIYTKAREWGIISCESPAKKVRAPRVNNARERMLSPQEVDCLLGELKRISPTGYGLVLLGYHTGGRRGEICSLTWSDVDLDNATLVFRDTKRGSARRVPMNRIVSDYLRKRQKDAVGPLVFPKQDGGVIRTISSSSIERAMDRLFNQGVTDRRHRVVFHTLRHSFASRLVAAGIPLNVVQELLGHSTLAMVQRYAHLAPGAQRQAVAVLEDK